MSTPSQFVHFNLCEEQNLTVTFIDLSPSCLTANMPTYYDTKQILLPSNLLCKHLSPVLNLHDKL
jgi:hypothetical protein